jgi:hypothetical protein
MKKPSNWAYYKKQELRWIGIAQQFKPVMEIPARITNHQEKFT